MATSQSITHDELERLFIGNLPLLDVRSPVEFHQGSFPRSTNIPLLTDDQRHQVGVCYKHDGQNAAISLGHELVSGDSRDRLIEHWRRFALEHTEGCLYCFRGGLRSRTVQTWLEESGVSYPLVQGGYKAMRRYLIDKLTSSVEQLDFIVVGGRTGSGKTLLLDRLPHHIDLEKLARHRGSSFGALVDAQPTNIDFENALSIELLRKCLVNASPVYLEDEGKMIGSVRMPDALRSPMPGYPAVILEAPLASRVKVSVDAYIIELLQAYQKKLGEQAGFKALIDHHESALSRIQKRFGQQRHDKTLMLLRRAAKLHEQGDLEGYTPYIETLLTEYYDPMYDYQLQKKKRPVLFTGSADEIAEWSRQATLSKTVS